MGLLLRSSPLRGSTEGEGVGSTVREEECDHIRVAVLCNVVKDKEYTGLGTCLQHALVCVNSVKWEKGMCAKFPTSGDILHHVCLLLFGNCMVLACF